MYANIMTQLYYQLIKHLHNEATDQKCVSTACTDTVPLSWLKKTGLQWLKWKVAMLRIYDILHKIKYEKCYCLYQ